MKLRLHIVEATLLVMNDKGGAIWMTDSWPDRLRIQDALDAFCGPRVDGWWIYHESDHRFLSEWLDQLSSLDDWKIGALAISDQADILNFVSIDNDSLLACASSAVLRFKHLWEVPLLAARNLVRLNLRLPLEVPTCTN